MLVVHLHTLDLHNLLEGEESYFLLVINANKVPN